MAKSVKHRKKQTTRKRKYQEAKDYLISHYKCDRYISIYALATLLAESLEVPPPGERMSATKFVVLNHAKVKKAKVSRVVPVYRKPDEGNFYKSRQWRDLRYIALRNAEATCGCCGATAGDGVQIHVDHIKPRSRFPELALDLSNLQLLCDDCNIGKSNIFFDDWRG